MPPALSPNSTPGIQMPAPPATPPIMGLDDRNMYLGRMMQQQPNMDKFGMENLDESQQMAWKGMQGGILAEMFPSMERGGGGQGQQQQQQMFHHHDPRLQHHHQAGQMSHQAQAAMAAQMQAQENLARLHHQQQQQHHQAQQQKHHHQQQQQQFHAMHGQPQHHHLYQQEMRGYPQHLMPAQSPPAAAPMQFHHGGPPGPRPRPVGGDDTSPGFTPEIPIPDTSESGNSNKDDLVIGSWNEECEKEGGSSGGSGGGGGSGPPPPPGLPPNMNMPPPNQQPPPQRSPNNEAFFGTFHVGGGNGGGRGGGGGGWGVHSMGRKEEDGGGGGMYDYASRGRGMGQGGRGGMDQQARCEDNDMMRGGMRGRPLMRGVLPRGGRGGAPMGRSVDHNQEKADGKNAAIEETKALMAKMRLEEKEAMEKFRKKKGISTEEEELGEGGGKSEEPVTPEVQPGAYRPREKRGRDDRKDGPRARIQSSLGRGGGGGGIGRGGLPLHQFQPPGGLPHPLFGMPGGPPEFRTPPFPGLEGFLAHHQGLGGHFPPGFPPHLAPGFAPGIFPGGYPGTLRGGRGGPGFNNRGGGGRGFPAGFPPRGFPPPLITPGRGGIGRGGGGGRGNSLGYQTGGGGVPRGRDRGKTDGGGGGSGSTATSAVGSGGDEATTTAPTPEENPLMNAINNTGKEVDTTDGEADDSNQPKNLFSEQVTVLFFL